MSLSRFRPIMGGGQHVFARITVCDGDDSEPMWSRISAVRNEVAIARRLGWRHLDLLSGGAAVEGGWLIVTLYVAVCR